MRRDAEQEMKDMVVTLGRDLDEDTKVAYRAYIAEQNALLPEDPEPVEVAPADELTGDGTGEALPPVDESMYDPDAEDLEVGDPETVDEDLDSEDTADTEDQEGSELANEQGPEQAAPTSREVLRRNHGVGAKLKGTKDLKRKKNELTGR